MNGSEPFLHVVVVFLVFDVTFVGRVCLPLGVPILPRVLVTTMLQASFFFFLHLCTSCMGGAGVKRLSGDILEQNDCCIYFLQWQIG